MIAIDPRLLLEGPNPTFVCLTLPYRWSLVSQALRADNELVTAIEHIRPTAPRGDESVCLMLNEVQARLSREVRVVGCAGMERLG